MKRRLDVLLRHIALGSLFTIACVDPPLPKHGPPQFVAIRKATPMAEAQVHLRRGEEMRWKVTWRGQRIGIARLGVRSDAGALHVESRFRTTGFAQQVNPVDYHLVTALGPGRGVDDLHSALGRLRAWADPKAGPGRLFVKHAKRMYQVDFASPQLDESLQQDTLRIEGQARAGDMRIDLTIWLSADSHRSPLQITLAKNGKQVRATLLEAGSES